MRRASTNNFVRNFFRTERFRMIVKAESFFIRTEFYREYRIDNENFQVFSHRGTFFGLTSTTFYSISFLNLQIFLCFKISTLVKCIFLRQTVQLKSFRFDDNDELGIGMSASSIIVSFFFLQTAEC